MTLALGSGTDARRWSVDDVAAWLQQSGYNELVDSFVSNQVDGVTLLTLGLCPLRHLELPPFVPMHACLSTHADHPAAQTRTS